MGGWVGILRTHDADAGVGPHVEKPGGEGTATHPVVARTVGTGDDHGDFGHLLKGWVGGWVEEGKETV